MRILKRRVIVESTQIESLWDFGKAHQVDFHFVKKVPNTQKSVFEAFMTSQTYMLFKLTVPSDEYIT